jgi:hypothetical protein
MKVRLYALISVLLAASLACSFIPSGGDDESESGQPSNVLFQDDFSDPSSGWDRASGDDGLTDYVDGIYRIYVNAKNTDNWSNPGLNFGDTQIEAEAKKVGGDDNNDFGLVCRYQDTNNFYFFVTSSDGYYGIGKFLDGEQLLIGDEMMQPSEEINRGNATNNLRADCVGNKLSIHVNGVLLAEYQDDSFTSGDVGLLAGSFDNPGTDIHFDNFVVRKP